MLELRNISKTFNPGTVNEKDHMTINKSIVKEEGDQRFKALFNT